VAATAEADRAGASAFPRNGVPDPNEDEFYEVAYDEDAGHFVMRRWADAPPLELPPAPLQRTMREQILDQQAEDGRQYDVADHQERERRRERLNSEAAERAHEAATRQREVESGAE